MSTVTSSWVRTQGVVCEAVPDLRGAVWVHDQQRADTIAFASGERAGEEDKALVCERVHERGMFASSRLIEDPAGRPGGTCFPDDGEEVHARAMR